jgi:hypothetical protein
MALLILAVAVLLYAGYLFALAGMATWQMVQDYRDGWSVDQLDWNITLQLWWIAIAATGLGAFFLWMR